MLIQLIEFVGLLLGIAYLVHQYSDKHVKLHIKVLSFVAWLLSFGFVFIVPLDIYWTLEKQNLLEQCTGANNNNSANEECQGLNGESTIEFETIFWVWRIVYWVTFVFTWLILPFFQDFEAAGEFDFMGKVRRSIKVNLIIMGSIAAIGIVFILYLIATEKISWDNLEGFLIGLANGFGILLVVILLGHGLVAIPKKQLRERDEEKTLKYCYFQAATIDEAKMNKRFELEEQVKFLLLAEQKYTQFSGYFQQILNLVPADIVKHLRDAKTVSESARSQLTSLGNVSMEKLAVLHKDTKQLVHQLKREQARWDALLDQSFFSQLGNFIDRFLWFWHCKAKGIVNLSLGIVFAFFSVLVLLGEISIFSDSFFNPFKYLINDDDNHVFGTQLLVLLPLLYISFCVYYGMFQIKIPGFFGLYKFHQTDAPSLMFFSINFARVTAPISYNYLKIVGVKGSAFEKILGAMDEVPLLGQANKYFFPMILVMLILFNLFDVYSKILSALGLKQFEFSDSFDDDRIDTGKVLVQRARDAWVKEFKKIKAMTTQLDKFEGYNNASSLRDHVAGVENFGRGYSSDNQLNDESLSLNGSKASTRLQQTAFSVNNQGNKFQNIQNFEDILSI